MKLLVQSDDYGITEAVSLGILEGIRSGIVRNTGLFANMPWAEKCVSWILPHLNEIAFGLDLNASTGPALLSAKQIPSLVQPNGYFLTSQMNRALDTDENDHDHVIYEEVYCEFEAQIERFIELVGRKPDYLHGHAYGTKTTLRASKDLAQKYDIPYSMDMNDNPSVYNPGMPWYVFPPTLEHQMESSLENYLLDQQDVLLSHEIVFLITHCGYVDAELLDLSSFTLYRPNDLHALTSDKIKSWIHSSPIELITYKDLNHCNT